MKCTTLLLYGFLLFTLIGCATAQVDRNAAKATSSAPAAAKVELISIPDNPSLPTFVVAVEPFTYAAAGTRSGGQQSEKANVPGNSSRCGWWASWLSFRNCKDSDAASTQTVNVQQHPDAIGPGVAAQLLTALSNDGNIQMVVVRSLRRRADGSYSCKLNRGERGPFIIRGTVTEFSETSDMTTESTGGSLGAAGLATGLLGIVTDTDLLTYAGLGVAAANPTLERAKKQRTGMVGLDLQIIDGRTQRIIGAFHSSGSFTTVSAVNGMSVFGIGKSSTDYAASAIGQATRAALNDALLKIDKQLATRVH